jgi:hypothetical protein
LQRGLPMTDGTPLWLSVTAAKTTPELIRGRSIARAAIIQCGPIQPGQCAVRAGGYCKLHLRRRQQRDLRVHRQWRLEVQAHNAPDIPSTRHAMPIAQRAACGISSASAACSNRAAIEACVSDIPYRDPEPALRKATPSEGPAPASDDATTRRIAAMSAAGVIFHHPGCARGSAARRRLAIQQQQDDNVKHAMISSVPSRKGIFPGVHRKRKHSASVTRCGDKPRGNPV